MELDRQNMETLKPYQHRLRVATHHSRNSAGSGVTLIAEIGADMYQFPTPHHVQRGPAFVPITKKVLDCFRSRSYVSDIT